MNDKRKEIKKTEKKNLCTVKLSHKLSEYALQVERAIQGHLYFGWLNEKQVVIGSDDNSKNNNGRLCFSGM